MGLFHAFLTIKCPECVVPLVRVSHSETNDMVVCPVCLGAGGYDDVLEEGGELSSAYGVSDDIRSLVRGLWAGRAGRS